MQICKQQINELSNLAAAAAGACCADWRAPRCRPNEQVTPQQIQETVINPAAPPELNSADVNAWLDGFMPYALSQRRHRRRGGDRGARRPGRRQSRLRIRQSRAAHAGRSGHDVVPAGLDLEALHLDRGDAAGRASADRSRRRHQHLHRLRNPGLSWCADHDASHHDAHDRLRRSHARPDRLGPGGGQHRPGRLPA